MNRSSSRSCAPPGWGDGVRRIRRTTLAILLATSLHIALPAFGAEKDRPCEAETAKLMNMTSTWGEIYKAALVLPPACFDGYFAEGISDTMVRKMRNEWHGFLVVLTMHPDESKFMGLVLDSINATLDPNDIRAIGHLAETSCRQEVHSQCRGISKQAAAALTEYDPPEPRWAQ